MAIFPAEQQIKLGRFAVMVRHANGQWSAESTIAIPTRYGPVNVCVRAYADESTTRAVLQALKRSELAQIAAHLRAFNDGSDEHQMLAAGVFDDVGKWFDKAGKTISRSKVFREVSDGISKVVKNPMFSSALSMIPIVGGPINAALQMGSMGSEMLAHAHDPQSPQHAVAKSKIAHIAQMASQGHPEARKAFDVLQSLQGSPSLAPGQVWSPGALVNTAMSLMPREISDSQYAPMVAQYAAAAANALGSAVASGADTFDMVAGADGAWRLHPRHLPPTRVPARGQRINYGLPYRPPAPRRAGFALHR